MKKTNLRNEVKLKATELWNLFPSSKEGRKMAIENFGNELSSDEPLIFETIFFSSVEKLSIQDLEKVKVKLEKFIDLIKFAKSCKK